MIRQLALSLGNRILIASAYVTSTAQAITNRTPAKEMGGIDCKPTLRATQLAPQARHTKQNTAHGKSSLRPRFPIVNLCPMLLDDRLQHYEARAYFSVNKSPIDSRTTVGLDFFALASERSKAVFRSTRG
jgi:hypothetical protein